MMMMTMIAAQTTVSFHIYLVTYYVV